MNFLLKYKEVLSVLAFFLVQTITFTWFVAKLDHQVQMHDQWIARNERTITELIRYSERSATQNQNLAKEIDRLADAQQQQTVEMNTHFNRLYEAMVKK